MHYNAASPRKATLSEQPRDSFNDDLAVNIGGALVAAQAVAPKMEEQKSGAILLTGGGFAFAPSPDFLSVSIGKAGIRALAYGLFEPFRDKGIHVATVTVCTFVSPEFEGCLIGRRTILAAVQPTERILDRRSELPLERMNRPRASSGCRWRLH